MTASDKLLDRVRKLLALATSPNVHEAAAAAAAAQALITRHRLQALLDRAAAEEQAAAEVDDGRDRPLEDARKIRKWKAVLAAGLADANGCRAYTVSLGRRRQLLCVAGHRDDQDAVHALWDWLVKRLEWLSATHGTLPGGQSQDRDWHESFRIGAADAVVTRLRAVQEEERAALIEAQAQGPDDGRQTALARMDGALAARGEAVDRFAEEELHLKKGRGITVRLDGLEAGRKAGASMPLPE
ncbi:MAG: DUF2786 domain-containing protein [Alphaproteobacteria bacterium]|nr:DUF2786 domain-containing protein [Alphaproteobacteria bacterium]